MCEESCLCEELCFCIGKIIERISGNTTRKYTTSYKASRIATKKTLARKKVLTTIGTKLTTVVVEHLLNPKNK